MSRAYMMVLATANDDTTPVRLTPNSGWVDKMPGLKTLVGDILGVILLLSAVIVIAAAVAWAYGRLSQTSHPWLNGTPILSATLIAILVGSMSGIVQYSMSQSLGVGSFVVRDSISPSTDSTQCDPTNTELSAEQRADCGFPAAPKD